MTEAEIEAYLATQFPVPVKSWTWHSTETHFLGNATLDVSGVIKDHDSIVSGIVAEKGISDDELKAQLGHSVDGVNQCITRLVAQKGAA